MNCRKLIELKTFSKKNFHKDFKDNEEMFFIETSGTDYLMPREVCSIESAAKFSNRHISVIMKSNQ